MKTARSIFPFFVLAIGSHCHAGEYIESSIESDIVPGPVEFAVLLPDGYDESVDPYPLLLNLHGGGGNRNVLRRQKPIFEEMWQDETLLRTGCSDAVRYTAMLLHGLPRWLSEVGNTFWWANSSITSATNTTCGTISLEQC